ncbi:MAG: RdgB/HAM1 family non-canonical purine NTP pyrophosphatase [Rhodanobacteraceae bacterium]|nr:RdgB/HAM1 family non-canonical purine NTP pyrophosphatase [Rhodanobacteraceae bacterium]
MKTIVLASGNQGKLVELGTLLGALDLTVVAQGDHGVADCDETGLTFVENALIKARHAARATGLPALADDSGLCVAALAGAPGLYSARYAGRHGDDAANNKRLLAELHDVSETERDAYFYCCLVLLRHAADPSPIIAEGRWHGRILRQPRGDRGFGYDPLFQPLDSAASAAELDIDDKNRLSHRGQAMVLLRDQLQREPWRMLKTP